MAGQSVERRDALKHLARASAAAAYPGFSRWAFAFAPAQSAPVKPRPAEYKPRFFTPAGYRALEALTDAIIPSDGSPGARQAGVAEFIDFMVSSDPAIQYRFRYGLTWIEARSRAAYGRPFPELNSAEQAALLEPLAYKAKHLPGQEDGRAFFRLLREYTVMGFYTTRIGLQELGYPGLRMYAASPECPHHDDPEHRRTGRTETRNA